MIEKNSNYKIENGIFSGFSATIHIPSGVKQIAPLALAPLENVKYLYLPYTLEKFEPSCLREPYDVMTKDRAMSWGISSHPSYLKEVHVCENHSIYQSKNGVLYSADGRQLIYLPPSRHNETVEIAEGVYELCKESCCFVKAKKIIFPKSLRRIDDCACCGSDLGKSDIPACEIGESAFQGCVLPEFTEIYNEVIPVKAFANCSGVKMIRLYDSVKLIKNEAFSYTRIEKIYIPPSTQIEENAFVHEVTKWIGSHVAKVHENGLKQMKSTYETCLENNKDIVIGGEAGSPAEAFANANGIRFEVVGSSDEEIKAWFGWQERIDEPSESGVFYETSDGEPVEFDKDNLPF